MLLTGKQKELEQSAGDTREPWSPGTLGRQGASSELDRGSGAPSPLRRNPLYGGCRPVLVRPGCRGAWAGTSIATRK